MAGFCSNTLLASPTKSAADLQSMLKPQFVIEITPEEAEILLSRYNFKPRINIGKKVPYDCVLICNSISFFIGPSLVLCSSDTTGGEKALVAWPRIAEFRGGQINKPIYALTHTSNWIAVKQTQ